MHGLHHAPAQETLASSRVGVLLQCQQPVESRLACPQILVGNKCDIDESKRAVPYSKGQALANEFGIKFFETSAKSNINVEEVSCPAAAGRTGISGRLPCEGSLDMNGWHGCRCSMTDCPFSAGGV